MIFCKSQNLYSFIKSNVIRMPLLWLELKAVLRTVRSEWSHQYLTFSFKLFTCTDLVPGFWNFTESSSALRGPCLPGSLLPPSPPSSAPPGTSQAWPRAPAGSLSFGLLPPTPACGVCSSPGLYVPCFSHRVCPRCDTLGLPGAPEQLRLPSPHPAAPGKPHVHTGGSGPRAQGMGRWEQHMDLPDRIC